MLENVLSKSVIFVPRPVLRISSRPGFSPWWRFRRPPGPVLAAFAVISALGFALFGGCASLRSKPPAQYVYVTAKETFLRDRLAAVTNRTGTVENGEKLEILEHGRRYFRVKTPNGEVGWIDEKAVATQEVFDAFQALGAEHKGDPAVASAAVRDDVNLHLKPGRQTEVFYRLPEGDKLQLLERATLPKPASGWAPPAKAGVPGKVPLATGAGTAAAPPIAMEDWWLARDAQGRTGWLLSRYEDVDAPDSVAKYAEGQRIVGAYVLATVNDPGVDQDDKNIPMYLTLMSPYLAGLPYDFDQVRVFTWNLKMHRYETAFREKNIEGYLPVKVDMEKDPYGKAVVAQTPLPTFTYKVLAADAGPVVPDPATGMVTPGRTIAKTYRLEGNLVRRVAAPGSKDEPEAHPVAEEKKAKAEKAGKKR
jgi:SH3-like domain-containing protein